MSRPRAAMEGLGEGLQLSWRELGNGWALGGNAVAEPEEQWLESCVYVWMMQPM